MYGIRHLRLSRSTFQPCFMLCFEHRSRMTFPWCRCKIAPFWTSLWCTHSRAWFDQYSLQSLLFINFYQEKPLVRQQLLPLISLGTWSSLLETRRQKEFAVYPRLQKQWTSLQKKQAALDADAKVCIQNSNLMIVINGSFSRLFIRHCWIYSKGSSGISHNNSSPS